jgi:hypothetical protein
VTFELLTGKRPFSAANEMALRWAHANSPRPLASAARPALGDGFDRLLVQALSVDPEQRFQTGKAFAAALRSTQSRVASASGSARSTEQQLAPVPVEPAPTESARAQTVVEPAPVEPAPTESARAQTVVEPASVEASGAPASVEPAPVASARAPTLLEPPVPEVAPVLPPQEPAPRTPSSAEASPAPSPRAGTRPPVPEPPPKAPPEPPTRVHAPQSPPQPRARLDDGSRDGRGRRKVLFALALAAVLGIAAGALAAGGVFSSGASSRSSGSGGIGGLLGHTQSSQATTSTTTATEPSTTNGAQSTQSSAAAVVGVLNTYESAYSRADLAGLGSLFTETVERHGLAPGGCLTVRGKTNVLAQYRSQFAGGRLAYRLVGLAPAQVAFSNPSSALVRTTYSIATSNNSGPVSFWLTNQSGRWLITKIVATCTPKH